MRDRADASLKPFRVGLVALSLAACAGSEPPASTDTDTSTSDPPTTSPPTTTGETTGATTIAEPGTTDAPATGSTIGTTSAGDTGDTGDPSTGPAVPAECDPIAPSADATDNRARILACLHDHGHARLAPGEFPIDGEIDMPDGAVLKGDDTWPRLIMTTTAQSLVRTHNNNEVAFLRLDGNHNMTVAHNAIVRLMGDDSFVHDNHVQNADGAVGDDHVTGVRFWNPESRGNRVFRNQIHHLHYGVIFDLFPNGADNLLEDNKIFEIRCDGVSFRGYGRAHGNEIYKVGYQCLNPPESPIPGGCFYTLENQEGAEIVGNHGHQACGQPLDLDRAARLVIKDNTFEEPGFVWDGHDFCSAGITAHLIDIRDSEISGNTFRNNGPRTIKTDPNHVMSKDGSGVPSDLPSGADQAIAFALTSRESGPGLATGNTISGNTFIANCAQPCVGLGYFTGRGSGYGPGQQWSAQTTNYFTGNNPFGSNIGSKRCGGNWFAADATCSEGDLEPSCNKDDPQHEGPGHDWTRSDDCPFYQ